MILAHVAACWLVQQAAAAPPPADLLTWKGLGYEATAPVPTQIGPQPIPTDEPALNAAVWKTRIVVYARLDTLGPEAIEGVSDRLTKHTIHVIEEPLQATIIREVEAMKRLVSEQTGGRIRLQPTVQIIDEEFPLLTGTAESFVARDLPMRVNGGRFDADDRIDRGPFDSMLVLHAIPWESDASLRVAGVPTRILSLNANTPSFSPGALATNLTHAWGLTVRESAREAGFLGADPATIWASWDGKPANTASYLRNLATAPVPRAEPAAWVRSTSTNTVTLKLPAAETLVYEETGSFRAGGADLPAPKVPVTLAPGTSLNVTGSSTADDGISIGLTFTDGTQAWASLARQFPKDGSPRSVSLDLSTYAGKTVRGLSLGPSPAQRKLNRRTFGPIAASFTRLAFGTEAPTAPLPLSPAEEISRVIALQSQSAPGAPMGERSEWVRLSYLLQLKQPEPGMEKILGEIIATSYDAAVSQLAVRVLGRMGTPAAVETLKATVLRALSDPARGAALKELARLGEPNLQALAIPLVTARSLDTRIALAEALQGVKSEAGAMVRITLHQQEDPAVLIATIRAADSANPAEMAKIQWLAVNDPYDAVRVESRRKLLSSKDAPSVAEGKRALEDESLGARRLFLERIQPDDAPAIQEVAKEALKQSDLRVLIAAIDAISRCPSLDPTLPDALIRSEDPRIQLAVSRWAKARAITLPPDLLRAWKESPDPDVRGAFGQFFA